MQVVWILKFLVSVTSYQFGAGTGAQKLSLNGYLVISTCNNGYENVENSTMCAQDSTRYMKDTAGVSHEDKLEIVASHNYHRARVSPTAISMMKMYWDDELARVAEKWAKQCVVGHDSSLNMSRYIPGYGVMPGQNAAFGYRNWAHAISGWHEEVDIYRYGQNPKDYLGEDGWRQIGHYTQMTTATSILIGCGFAKCEDSIYKRFFFCNYLTGQPGFAFPYKKGKPCSACPDSCDGGSLCDCGNKFCFNGGTLDINSCQCRCKDPWFGPKCMQTPCPGIICKNGGTLNTNSCTCSCVNPYEGITCETNPCPGLQCENHGIVNPKTCTCKCGYPYSGRTCERISCRPRLDPFYCGGAWPQTFCSKFSNVKRDCAVMCGLCPAPCNGKSCQNDGKLDLASCTCSCKKPFIGTVCDRRDCPKSDPPHCGTQWPKIYCDMFSNVPQDCPFMCGIWDAHCSGKTCLNKGQLDVDTCKCVCGPGYSGETCETRLCSAVTCRNGGSVQFKTCTCSCTDMYTGRFCERRRCLGVRCQNGGSLNYPACSCSCAAFYSGKFCEINNCPKTDPWYCGSDWPPDFCIKYSNVPKSCPIMCGLCTAPCQGKSCLNKGELNTDNCRCKCRPGFTGERCQTEICPGNKCQNGGKMNFLSCQCSCPKPYAGVSCEKKNCPKSDAYFCGTDWPVNFCSTYSNVPGECPYMCGLCQAVCMGKKCENNGELNVDTCTCKCEPAYTGETCQIERCLGLRCQNGGKLELSNCRCSCSSLYSGRYCQSKICRKPDPYYCGKDWPKSYCGRFSNVPEACPIMCGLCKDRCGGLKCQNGGTINFNSCKCQCKQLYMGTACEKTVCPSSDPHYCGTDWPKSYCQKFSNVPETCPYMCGLCQA